MTNPIEQAIANQKEWLEKSESPMASRMLKYQIELLEGLNKRVKETCIIIPKEDVPECFMNVKKEIETTMRFVESMPDYHINDFMPHSFRKSVLKMQKLIADQMGDEE